MATTTERAGRPRWQRRLIGVGLALLTGVVLFAAGWFTGKRPVPPLRDSLDLATTRAALLAADAAVYRGAVSLDERNFGTANEHLDRGVAALASLPQEDEIPGLSKERTAEIRSVAEELGRTDFTVAADLAQQRATVLSIARRLDAAILELPGGAPASAAPVVAQPAAPAPATDRPAAPERQAPATDSPAPALDSPAAPPLDTAAPQ